MGKYLKCWMNCFPDARAVLPRAVQAPPPRNPRLHFFEVTGISPQEYMMVNEMEWCEKGPKRRPRCIRIGIARLGTSDWNCQATILLSDCGLMGCSQESSGRYKVFVSHRASSKANAHTKTEISQNDVHQSPPRRPTLPHLTFYKLQHLPPQPYRTLPSRHHSPRTHKSHYITGSRSHGIILLPNQSPWSLQLPPLRRLPTQNCRVRGPKYWCSS